MKKLLKLSTLLLVIAMLFNLVACSSFGKIQKALEDAGYAIIENKDNAVTQEAENDERVANLHVFTNAQSLSALELLKITIVVVIEFKATQDLVEYFKDSATLQGIVADVKEDGTVDEIYAELKNAGLACENCIVAPIGADASNVLSKIKAL